MVDNGRDELLRLLGRLEEGLAGVKEDLAEVKLDNRDAAASRNRIHEKLEDGDRRLTEMESTVRVMAGVLDKTGTRIDQLEPTVKAAARSLRAWNKRYLAILAGIGLVIGWLWWLLTSNWGWLMSNLIHFIKGT